MLFDADQGFPYIKRFMFEPTARKQRFIGDNDRSRLILLTDTRGAMLQVSFAAPDDFRDPLIIDAEDYIGLKSLKAKGKRLTTFSLGEITELEPKEVAADDDADTAETETDVEAEEIPDDKSDDEVRDELTGQQRLF